MFKPVSSSLAFAEREKEIQAFWKDNDIFNKYMNLRKGSDTYTFYDGPPTANGAPHIGHVITRAYKDLIPRYHTMKGRDVLRKAGWDTHGLPVEIEVEKHLHLDGKQQIEAYGIEAFIKECKRSVWKFLDKWREMSDTVGFWVDMDDPYVTYHNSYIESEWWSLKEIHKKGLLYQGHKSVPYCPRCGTALSSHEVAQGYKQVTDSSVTVRFRLEGEPDTSFLAWTTTPWTLPSNLALCLNPKETYAKVRYGEEKLILAKALLDKVLGEDYTIIEEYAGERLKGTKYVPLYASETDKPAYFAVTDAYVTLTDGTGIVHVAPAFGEDDSRVGRIYDLPHLQLVDEAGNMIGTDWAGLFVKEADPLIVEDLRQRGLLFSVIPYEHDYPFCWRCDTPLLYYARPTWFIRMTAIRDKLIASNKAVRWLPENIKDGRMGNFIENVVDWGLSRERYWGTPLPIWKCANGHIHVIGSVAELKELGKNVPDDIELHRPYIDAVEIACPECGEPMQRVKEVIDCWYDSGSMPFAQWHYPFENKEVFEKRFPAQFISEAVDQTRGWFYTLIAISTLLFDRAPFESCLVLGHVQDDKGQKMSKHKGNVITPDDILNETGADAVRWYFYINGAPWLPSRFSLRIVEEAQRRFMGTLWNTYSFFVLYANIDEYKGLGIRYEVTGISDIPLIDRWLLSRLNSLVKLTDESLERIDVPRAARAISDFVDELSNWYVRRCRERFWGKGVTSDKKSAFDTLYVTLTTLARILAPFMPFLSETMYQNLARSHDAGAPESVHLTDFPAYDESLINPALDENMDKLIRAVSLGRSCRNAANIKVRQPIATLYLQGAKLSDEFIELLKDELNVKDVELAEGERAFVSYKIKPQLRTLGPRLGKQLAAVRKLLEGLDGVKVVSALNRGESLKLDLDGGIIELSKDDLIIEPIRTEGYAAETDGEMTVALDTTLTPELVNEGFARELISKIQSMRRDAGLEVTDRINVKLAITPAVAPAAQTLADMITTAVLASSLELFGYAPSISPLSIPEKGWYSQEWDINGQPATISISSAA